MKLSKLTVALVAVFSFAFFTASSANAQFGGVLNKTKSKVKEAENKTKPAPKS
jgi:ABC-type cobalt transport system substrate-binding protein